MASLSAEDLAQGGLLLYFCFHLLELLLQLQELFVFNRAVRVPIVLDDVVQPTHRPGLDFILAVLTFRFRDDGGWMQLMVSISSIDLIEFFTFKILIQDQIHRHSIVFI